jgi:RimJ/RimL family protein N-acetyltransferase
MADPELTLEGWEVTLRSTRDADLFELIALWNDGEVMKWVGFPDGLRYDRARAERWLNWLRTGADLYHFVVHAPAVGFCGEAFCRMDRERRRASLDIKFIPRARGKGRSRAALLALIEWVFRSQPEADCVWTEPHPPNLAARTLYYGCGLRPAERPPDLDEGPSFWVLHRADYLKGRS